MTIKITFLRIFFPFDIGSEIRRLWINWIFFILLGVLNFLNIFSILPTLHQFITNPESEDLNSTSLKVSDCLMKTLSSELYYPHFYYIV